MWQPIETAPKDKRRVLVWVRYRDGGDAEICEYEGPGWRGRPTYNIMSDCGMDGDPALEEPTHWMPLPEPPAGTP